MHKRKDRRSWGATGLALAAAFALLGASGAAKAQHPPPDDGMPALSLARGQSARVNVYLAMPPEVGEHCTLVLSFLDQYGETFEDRAGVKVSEEFAYNGADGLGYDEVASLVLPAKVAFLDAGKTQRVLFRADLQQHPPPDDQCPPVVAVVEIFDDETNRTTVIAHPPQAVTPSPGTGLGGEL